MRGPARRNDRRDLALVGVALAAAVLLGIATGPYGWTGSGYGRLPELSSPTPTIATETPPVVEVDVVDDAATPDPSSTSARPTAGSRSTVRPTPVASPDPTPRWVLSVARCIIAHESAEYPAGQWPKRPYDAVRTDGGTASGAYQFIDTTWRTLSREAGFGSKYLRAVDAPPWVQDAVFAYAATHGYLRHWSGTGCPGT